MLWIFATDYHHYAFAPDNLAAIATRFDWGAYFHDLPSSFVRSWSSTMEKDMGNSKQPGYCIPAGFYTKRCHWVQISSMCLS